MSSKPLVVIVGPTASGKSALGLQIAQRHNGEIIAADSRTIYRGMDIGTAKPSVHDQQLVRHHLVDIREPNEPFSAAEFKKLATRAINDIHARGKLPVLVGGTGLYVDSVIFDYQFGPAAERQRRAQLSSMSIEELQTLCRQSNINLPINSRNKRHLVRTLESGGLLSQEKSIRPNTLVVGLTMDKEKRKAAIEKRAQEMIERGVVPEVARIGQKYSWQGEALKANIYRIFKGVIEGSKTLSEAKDEFISSDMGLAKRQITWFKRNPHIVWSDDPAALLREVDTFLHHQKY